MITKHTLRVFILWLLVLPVNHAACAGDKGVGVTLVSYTLDTINNDVNLGYTITINAEVTNYDSTPFYGTINFGLHNNMQVLSNTGIFDKPPYSGDSVSLEGHETVPAIFSINVNSPYFMPGPDVVVVWPISKAPIADSIVIPITILAPSGISGPQEIPFTYFIANNHIILKTADSKIDFKQVRIYNDVGQQLSEITGDFITSIPLPQLLQGIYFCQLTATDGKKTTIKFEWIEK